MIWIGKYIEIPEINHETKTVQLLLHLKKRPTKEQSDNLKQCGLMYLINEGFLPENYDEWQCLSGIVFHEPKNK